MSRNVKIFRTFWQLSALSALFIFCLILIIAPQSPGNDCSLIHHFMNPLPGEVSVIVSI